MDRSWRAEIARRYGWKVEIIDGHREAELSYRAAATGLTEVPQERVVFDVGGGSTEIVSGREDRINFAQSFPIGAVKLAEACALTDKVSAGKMKAAMSHLETVLFLRIVLRPSRAGDMQLRLAAPQRHWRR